MTNYNQRLIALEQVKTNPLAELPLIVCQTTTDDEMKILQRNGRKVYRASDPAFIEEFV